MICVQDRYKEMSPVDIQMNPSAVTKALSVVYANGVTDESICAVFKAIHDGNFMYDSKAKKCFCLNKYGIWEEDDVGG